MFHIIVCYLHVHCLRVDSMTKMGVPSLRTGSSIGKRILRERVVDREDHNELIRTPESHPSMYRAQ